MNINAIEMMALDKRNMNLGLKNNTPTTEPQVPVIKPQFAMNGLEAQGVNNVAFQGLNTGVLKKPAMKFMMAAAALGAVATSFQSCDKYTEPDVKIIHDESYFNIDVDVNVDMSAMTTLMSQWMAYMQEQMALMREQNETMKNLYNAFMQFMNEYKQGRLSDAEFQQKVVDYMLNDANKQDALIGITTDQKTLLEDIKAKLAAGEITYAQAFQQIITILGNIEKGVYSVLSELQSFHQDYLDGKDQSTKYLKLLYNQGKVNSANLTALTKSVDNMDKNLDKIVANTDSLIVIANDPKKHQELMDILTQIKNGQITRPDLQAMLDAMGISINDAITMSAADLTKAINNFRDTYIKTEQAQTDLLQELVNKQFTLQELKDILDDYVGAGGSGMSLAEFKAFMEARDARRDEDNWSKFEKYMEDKGFTTLPGGVATANDLLTHIDNDLHNMPDYANIIADVLNELKGLKLGQDETNAILKDIYDLIDAFRNDCKECCENIIKHLKELAGTHEGILD